MEEDEVLVSLHCHSTCSDGSLPPDRLAEHVASLGVRYAALTDHDTVQGLRAFRSALARRGVGVVDGVELTVSSAWGELHLLGYGIDPENPELVEMLEGTRRQTDEGMQGLVDSLKRIGGRDVPMREIPAVEKAIRVVHGAGGIAVLAHPFSYRREGSSLESAIRGLKESGLDGIEAAYAPYSREEKTILEALADTIGLLVTAGGDYHGSGMTGSASPAAPMSRARWNSFRDRLLHSSPLDRTARSADDAHLHARETGRVSEGRFAARIVLPAAAAMVLFTLAIFAMVLPRFEQILLERKKEMIRELTNSAASILTEYAADEAAGRTTRAQAQSAAVERIRDLRYGAEGKDYFWITDMHPTMIMHPYRTDLEGTNVGAYMDANGVRVFVEFVNAVRQKEEGYVEYLWQWKDDAHRIVPKLSFVKRFAPWDWVIGTGIYLEDVKAEIGRMTGSLIWLSIGIVAVLGLLLFFVAQQSLAIERRRRKTESALRESHERYRFLVEASTEGMVVVIDGSCAYANRTFLEMLAYTESELSLLGIADIVRPYAGGEEEARSFIDALAGTSPPTGTVPGTGLECSLVGRGGRLLDAVLTASEIDIGGRQGSIVAVKDVSAWRKAEEGLGEGMMSALWHGGGIAFFRAAWGRRPYILDCNEEARRIFGVRDESDLRMIDIFSRLSEPREGERLFADLGAAGAVKDRELVIARPGEPLLTVSLSAVLAKDEEGAIRHIEGMARDVSATRRLERTRGELIAELESRSLFLADPAGNHSLPAPTISPDSPIRAAAELMAGGGALLVADHAGNVLGIVTSRDLGERALATGLASDHAVREIMTAPLRTISCSASLADALLMMGEHGIGHLPVRDHAGKIVGMIARRLLLDRQPRSLAGLSRKIAASRSIEEAAACRGTLIELVRGCLGAGARARTLGRIFASASDLLVAKLVQLAERDLGRPPSAFAFVALGSEGRGEQTPGSDQDNAIVFDLPPGGQLEEVRKYFLSLGERVCGWLDSMGVRFCAGGIMAKTPSWCASFAEWTRYFSRWINEPEPDQILDFNIFFDLRCVAGEQPLVQRLQDEVASFLGANPPFFLHHARDALSRKLPALRRGTDLDSKDAMAPFVTFARIYALRHGVAATNTFERLDALRDAGVLDPGLHGEITEAYGALLKARIAAQLSQRGNSIDLSSLARAEETLLRDAVTRLGMLQRKISWDFLGTAV